MKIIKGGNKDINDQFELDKQYAKELKSNVDKAFGEDLLKKDMHYIYDVACFCWNLKQITPSDDKEIHKNFKVTLSQFELDESEFKSSVQLFNALPDAKSDLNRIIHSFEIEMFNETNYHLTVTTISQKEYLKILQEFDTEELYSEEDEAAEFVPNPIDRSLLLITPKDEAYEKHTVFKNLNNLDKKKSLAVLLENTETKTAFKQKFTQIKVDLFTYLFESLEFQFTQEPEKMSFGQFEKLFDYQIIPEVFDLEFNPVYKIY